MSKYISSFIYLTNVCVIAFKLVLSWKDCKFVNSTYYTLTEVTLTLWCLNNYTAFHESAVGHTLAKGSQTFWSHNMTFGGMHMLFSAAVWMQNMMQICDNWCKFQFFNGVVTRHTVNLPTTVTAAWLYPPALNRLFIKFHHPISW